MKIATLKLASCSGCHIALLDTHEKFLEIVDKIVFSPILLDTRELPNCDIFWWKEPSEQKKNLIF